MKTLAAEVKLTRNNSEQREMRQESFSILNTQSSAESGIQVTMRLLSFPESPYYQNLPILPPQNDLTTTHHPADTSIVPLFLGHMLYSLYSSLSYLQTVCYPIAWMSSSNIHLVIVFLCWTHVSSSLSQLEWNLTISLVVSRTHVVCTCFTWHFPLLCNKLLMLFSLSD